MPLDYKVELVLTTYHWYQINVCILYIIIWMEILIYNSCSQLFFWSEFRVWLSFLKIICFLWPANSKGTVFSNFLIKKQMTATSSRLRAKFWPKKDLTSPINTYISRHGASMVFCYQNYSNLLWEKIVIERFFETQGWMPNFEIIITICLNRERSENFLFTEWFFDLFLGVSQLS